MSPAHLVLIKDAPRNAVGGIIHSLLLLLWTTRHERLKFPSCTESATSAGRRVEMRNELNFGQTSLCYIEWENSNGIKDIRYVVPLTFFSLGERNKKKKHPWLVISSCDWSGYNPLLSLAGLLQTRFSFFLFFF